jgi:hypothetical protein
MNLVDSEIRNELVISRRRLGLTCAGVLTAGLVPVLSSCAAAEPAVETAANPATWEWFTTLAQDVAASLIANEIDDVFKGIFRGWGERTDNHFNNQQRYRWYWYGIYGVETAPAVMVGLSKSKQGDPLTDGLLVCMQEGKTAIVLPGWAWQGLSMFVAGELQGKTGNDLAEGRQLCALTLIPCMPRVKSGSSPLRTVGYITYETTTGWVEISRQSTSSGSTVEVLATGLASQGSTRTSKVFNLPTTISES